jgi:hydroxymethylpyrimidine/phosphomethylpyrimidine kinase
VTIWLLGGFDPTGGAGILRDFATAGVVAPSLPVRCVITAWTRQGDGAPARAEPVDPDRLLEQLRGLGKPRAVKIGLVPAALVEPLLEGLEPVEAPIVVDPVLCASDGGALGSTASSLAPLIERATLVTPNLDEAAALTGVHDDAVDRMGAALTERFPGVSILVKGGHSSDPNCVVDHLWSRGQVRHLARRRAAGPDPRGTGCALATAIACRLGQGERLDRAVDDGVAWLDDRRTRVVMQRGAAHLPIR